MLAQIKIEEGLEKPPPEPEEEAPMPTRGGHHCWHKKTVRTTPKSNPHKSPYAHAGRLPGEIPYKEWIYNQAEVEGCSVGVMYSRHHRHPERYPVTLRHVDQRTVFVRKA